MGGFSVSLNKEHSNLLNPNKLELLSPQTNSINNSIESNQLKFTIGIDSNRLMEIHQTIDGIYKHNNLTPSGSHQVFPIEMSKLIEGYDYNRPLQDSYNKVIDNLGILDKEKESLDFYNKDFAKKLYLILVPLKEKISSRIYYIFKSDLSKLLFKWLIHMRQEIVDTDEQEFKKISNDLKSIADLLDEDRGIRILFNFELTSIDSYRLRVFCDLIKSEMFEHSHVFHLFASAIEHFYLETIKNEDQSIDCEELKNVYFNGSYEKNIILKYLIVLYDPKGEMGKCIVKDDSHSNKLAFYSPIKIDKQYLLNLRLRGPDDLKIFETVYTSRSIIEFFLSSGRKFKTAFSNRLYFVLKNLKEMGLMKREIVERLFAFRIMGQLKWDLNEFKTLLNEYKEEFDISEIEIQVCNEYLSLFDS